MRKVICLAVLCLTLAACESAALPTPTPVPASPETIAQAAIDQKGCTWVLEQYDKGYSHATGIKQLRNAVDYWGIAPIVLNEDVELLYSRCKDLSE